MANCSSRIVSLKNIVTGSVSRVIIAIMSVANVSLSLSTHGQDSVYTHLIIVIMCKPVAMLQLCKSAKIGDKALL